MGFGGKLVSRETEPTSGGNPLAGASSTVQRFNESQALKGDNSSFNIKWQLRCLGKVDPESGFIADCANLLKGGLRSGDDSN